MSQRLAIKNKLNTDIPTIPVYQAHVVNEFTPKPFIIVTPFDEGATNINIGFDLIYLVFAYIAISGDAVNLDTMVNNIKASLHKKDITYDSKTYNINYIGFYGNSVIEEDWQALGQGLQFRIDNIVT